jgi:hypothetical protein
MSFVFDPFEATSASPGHGDDEPDIHSYFNQVLHHQGHPVFEPILRSCLLDLPSKVNEAMSNHGSAQAIQTVHDTLSEVLPLLVENASLDPYGALNALLNLAAEVNKLLPLESTDQADFASLFKTPISAILALLTDDELAIYNLTPIEIFEKLRQACSKLDMLHQSFGEELRINGRSHEDCKRMADEADRQQREHFAELRRQDQERQKAHREAAEEAKIAAEEAKIARKAQLEEEKAASNRRKEAQRGMEAEQAKLAKEETKRRHQARKDERRDRRQAASSSRSQQPSQSVPAHQRQPVPANPQAMLEARNTALRLYAVKLDALKDSMKSSPRTAGELLTQELVRC